MPPGKLSQAPTAHKHNLFSGGVTIMINQYDKIALCAYVIGEKVKYFKEYSLRGRIVATECIPYSEFVRLSDQLQEANNR